MKRVLIASLVVALTMTACATETAECVTPTTEPVIEAVETVEVTEPIVETEPVVEVTETVTEPVVEVQVTESVVELKLSESVEPIKEVMSDETSKTVEPKDGYLGEFKLTAYCACAKCCGKSDGITATGTVATQGRTIAVDPSVIPYGTVVNINGNNYTAEDCGGAIGGKRIDVFFNNHSDALNFGVQYADVYLIRS